MAAEAENSTVPLHYEEEEARILEANQRFRLFLQVEESGCLEILKDLLAYYGTGYFDVFHLTGHACIEEDTPYFITETEIGEEKKASAKEITKVFRTAKFPQLMFLSGCHSGEAAQEGATPSLAEALIKNGAKAVLGWGHEALDTEATDAAAILYEQLNRGTALADSLAITYQELLEQKSKDWHLLRLYVGDTLPGALVTAPGHPHRLQAPPLSYATRFLDKERKVTVADRMSFVGRRRQIQHCIKALTPPSEKVGVIIYGFGGYGKSSLALRLCDRLTDFIPLVWEGQIDQDKFASKLSEEISVESSDLGEILQNYQDALDIRLRRVFKLLSEKSNKSFLFVFDNFEDNLELVNQETRIKENKENAVNLLNNLIKAIQNEYSQHRIIITSRYDLPSFSHGNYLERQELNELRGADLRKKLNRLGAFKGDSRVNNNLQERAKRLADGNPRLLEWLDRILTDGTLENESILQRLETLEKNDKELREEVLAQALIDQINNELKEILSRGLIFEIPVPKRALQQVCEGITNLDNNIERAIRLGLLSVSPDGKLLRVPRILPVDIHKNQEALAKQGALALYELWWNPEWTEEQAQEILRLALIAKEKSILLEVGDKLTKKLNQNRRYNEVVNICQEILNFYENLQILNNLALAYWKVGEMDGADKCFQKAFKKPFLQTTEIQLERCDLLLNNANFLSAQSKKDLPKTFNNLKKSLRIAERLNDLLRKAWANIELGRYTLYQANELKIEEMKKKQELFQESETYSQTALDIGIQINDLSGQAWSLHHLGMLKKSMEEHDCAIQFILGSMSIQERIGDIVKFASNLHLLGTIYAQQEQFEQARQCFQESLDIKEEYIKAFAATTAYQWAKLEEKQGHILRALELVLTALDYNQRFRGRNEGDNWTLIKRLFKKWRSLNFPNIEEGCNKSAQDLMQQLIELSDNTRYQYRYGKAIALWGLGKIAAYHEGDRERGLQYLEDSRTILVDIDSEDRYIVQECINRLRFT
jgi:tetratricopeptide (TPR) repeat protein